jgi:hypothetical protein
MLSKRQIPSSAPQHHLNHSYQSPSVRRSNSILECTKRQKCLSPRIRPSCSLLQEEQKAVQGLWLLLSAVRPRLPQSQSFDHLWISEQDKMSNTDFLGRAIGVVKKAIDHDTAGEYEQAYQLYYQSRKAPWTLPILRALLTTYCCS